MSQRDVVSRVELSTICVEAAAARAGTPCVHVASDVYCNTDKKSNIYELLKLKTEIPWYMLSDKKGKRQTPLLHQGVQCTRLWPIRFISPTRKASETLLREMGSLKG